MHKLTFASAAGCHWDCNLWGVQADMEKQLGLLVQGSLQLFPGCLACPVYLSNRLRPQSREIRCLRINLAQCPLLIQCHANAMPMLLCSTTSNSLENVI